MPKTERTLQFHNLVGLRIRILEHPDNKLVGLSGIVVLETRNTFVIRGVDGKLRRVLKVGYFEFELPNGRSVILEGSKVTGRLEERIKRARKL